MGNVGLEIIGPEELLINNIMKPCVLLRRHTT